jgi:hypothetical protein
MKKIITGKLYDTENADFVVDLSATKHGREQDFDFDSTGLYRSPKGQFFIAGRGGANSRWRRKVDTSTWTAGEGLELVTDDEARELVAECGTTDDYRQWFGEPEVG